MNDELHESYQVLKRVFGGNEVILVVYHDRDLLAEPGSKRQLELCRRLDGIPGVSGQSIGISGMIKMIESFNLERIRGIMMLAGFDLSTKLLIEQANTLFEGFTHSRDGTTGAVVVLLQSKEDSAIPRGAIVESVRKTLKDAREELEFESDILMVGEPVMVADGFRMVKADGSRLGWVATIALSLVVLVAFRSIRWTLIPAAMVQFSLLTSDAAVALMNIQVTIVGSMSTSIITVIAVSTTIHLIVRIRRNIRQGQANNEATENALQQLAVPITFACLTDAIGFGALWFAELEPVKDFATVMFVGSLLVLFAFWSMVPTLALFRFCDSIPFWNLKTEQTGLHRAFSRGLSLPLRFSRRFPVVVLLTAAGLIVFSLIGISRNTIESDFTKNFRSDSHIVESYQFVEDNLGGAGVWDVILPAPKPLTTEYLQRVKKLQDRLRGEVGIRNPTQNQARRNGESEFRPGLTKVLSLVDAIEAFSNKPIGELSQAHLSLGLSLFESRLPAFKKSLLSDDPQIAATEKNRTFYRIMLRSMERTPSETKKEIIKQVDSICREEFPAGNEEASIRTTGFYVLLTYMIDSVIRDQWRTFLAAAVGIILMLVVSLRDVRLALIGLMPNLLPIFLLLGLFGWFNFPINLGIALIAAVAIGLSIDSSIHYIYDFQRQKESCSTAVAVEQAQDQVGRALIYATVALVIGFSSLCLSEFLPTVYFGATAMIAMIGGLVGNLFLLPLFIGMVYRK